MKKTVLIWTIILTLVAAAPAAANYIWLDVSGEQTATEGDTITLSVYAHAEEEADALSCFAVSVGFDDEALGGELTYVSYTLNDVFDTNSFYAGEYEEGGSLASSGNSWVYDIGGDGPMIDGAMTSVSVDADSDILLFTITFTYTNAEYTWTGDDVWLEFNSDTLAALYWDSGGDTDIDAARASADFAAVPIPGAALLLGSGLLGLVGIRRKS